MDGWMDRKKQMDGQLDGQKIKMDKKWTIRWM